MGPLLPHRWYLLLLALAVGGCHLIFKYEDEPGALDARVMEGGASDGNQPTDKKPPRPDTAPARCGYKVAWVKQIGGDSTDNGKAVALDRSGNVYLAGSFNKSIKLGNAILTSKGAEDAFLASYKADGTARWLLHLGGGKQVTPAALALDQKPGQLVMAGSFYGQLNTAGSATVGEGAWDVFVARYTSAAARVGLAHYGGASADKFEGMALDRSGNLYLSITFQMTLTRPSGFKSKGGTDGLLLSFKPDGTRRWAAQLGGSGSDRGGRVAWGEAGGSAVYWAGEIQDTAEVGGMKLVSLTAGNTDAMIARITAAGAPSRGFVFGGASSEKVLDMLVDPAGNLLFTGQYYRGIKFGSQNHPNVDLHDIFLARYKASTLARQWSKVFGSKMHDYAHGLVLSPGGRVVIAGYAGAALSLGGGKLSTSGVDDLVLATYGIDGKHCWSAMFGGAGYQRAADMAQDSKGNLYLAVSFQETATIAGITYTAANKSWDALLIKMTPN